jgi:hypothetical protein
VSELVLLELKQLNDRVDRALTLAEKALSRAADSDQKLGEMLGHAAVASRHAAEALAKVVKVEVRCEERCSQKRVRIPVVAAWIGAAALLISTVVAAAVALH